MANNVRYIDGFVLPIPKNKLGLYGEVVKKVAGIWKEHGALAYREFAGDDLKLEGTRSFPDALDAKEDEVVIFGWVEFASRADRDRANELVASDPRMADLVAPLTDPDDPVFDASRMVYGCFKPL